MTYGNGRFWSRKAPVSVAVTGLDLDPARARDIVGDFRALDVADGSFDVCIFDPPYQWDMGKGKRSLMGGRFRAYGSADEARAAIEAGSREAWRVSPLEFVVKVQDYVHASRSWWLSRWVQDAMPVEPYDFLMLEQPRSKLRDPKWTRQLSVRRRHTTFWVWRKDGSRHRERRP